MVLPHQVYVCVCFKSKGETTALSMVKPKVGNMLAYLDTSLFLNGREQVMKGAIPAGFQSAHLRTRLVKCKKYRI